MAEADVVVIGSGATGSLLAARLGSAGRKVVMLEAGPPRNSANYTVPQYGRDV